MRYFPAEDSSSINKTPLLLLALFLLTAYLILIVVLHDRFREMVIQNKLDDLNHHLVYQAALREYVQTDLKPVFYELQRKQILSTDYFDPHVLSGTFIVRKVFEAFDRRVVKSKSASWHYRLAAKNPLNPVNQATEAELKLLEQFNQDRNLKKINRVETVDGVETLYVALPVDENTKRCLRCHGSPDSAPKDMVERYGKVKGYYENVGDIRAFISYRLPLSEFTGQTHSVFLLGAGAVLLLFVFVFGLMSWVYISESRRKQVLLYQQEELNFVAHHDFLTQLYNRQALNRYLPKLLEKYARQHNGDQALWVMMLDLDFFKSINEQYGRDVGDLTLQGVARILENKLQNLEGAAAYRLRGQEFLLLLPNIDRDLVVGLYESIQLALQNINVEGFGLVVNTSAGATLVARGEEQYSVLKRVDGALFSAKNQGRAQLVVSSS